MSFRLVPNSVTLDDLELRNSPNSGALAARAFLRGGAIELLVGLPLEMCAHCAGRLFQLSDP